MTLVYEVRWFIDALLIIFLMWLAGKLMGVSPDEFLRKLVDEFVRLAHVRWTVGSLNAAGLIVITVLAIVIIVDPGGFVGDLLRERFDRSRAAEYTASANPTTLFQVLSGYAAFSVFMTFWRERRGD